MPMSEHLQQIRNLVGHRLLCLPSVTGIVRNAEGSLLLVRNTDSTQWTTPGGMIEPLEIPAESVVRELKEELNIDVVPTRLLGAFSGPEFRMRYPNGDEVVYVTNVFECELRSGVPEPDMDELEACRFVTNAKYKTLETPEWLNIFIDCIDNDRQYNV